MALIGHELPLEAALTNGRFAFVAAIQNQTEVGQPACRTKPVAVTTFSLIDLPRYR